VNSSTSTLQQWLSTLRRWIGNLARGGRPDARPQGEEGIATLGHRHYVGGRWEELGRLQFEYLKSQGLRPEHVLVDIACGSLRLGVHVIPYLEPEHYWGVEKEPQLIEAGLKQELSPEIRAEKKPGFVISRVFGMPVLQRPADFLWMHSLWTHLTLDQIQLCLQQCRTISGSETRCFATFFESAAITENPAESHDHAAFFYTVDQLRALADEVGWSLKYLGDWGHPRGQKMLELRVKPV